MARMCGFRAELLQKLTLGAAIGIIFGALLLWSSIGWAQINTRKIVGFVTDPSGAAIPDATVGYRLDELRAAMLRVQLKKLPRVIAAMGKSKYRIRKFLEKSRLVHLRKVLDPAGDTGCFLITTYPDALTAQRINRALRAEGIVTSPQGVSNVVMTDWGLHLHTNNISLVNKASIDSRGFPWKLAENAGLGQDYRKGACPQADSLFERSVLLAIPSCLTEQDENDIIRAFDKVLGELLPG